MFIGRIEKGFEFLGYRFSPEGLTVAQRTVERFVARATRLYEQERERPDGPSALGDYVRRWERWVQAGRLPGVWRTAEAPGGACVSTSPSERWHTLTRSVRVRGSVFFYRRIGAGVVIIVCICTLDGVSTLISTTLLGAIAIKYTFPNPLISTNLTIRNTPNMVTISC